MANVEKYNIMTFQIGVILMKILEEVSSRRSKGDGSSHRIAWDEVSYRLGSDTSQPDRTSTAVV